MSESKSYKPAHGGYPSAARRLVPEAGPNIVARELLGAAMGAIEQWYNYRTTGQRIVDIPRRDAGGIVERFQVVGFEDPVFGTSYRIEDLRNCTICAYWSEEERQYVQRSWPAPGHAQDFMHRPKFAGSPFIPR